MYVIYRGLSQAKRPRTDAQQREIDRVNGELAAALAQLGHSAATPWRSVRHALHDRRLRVPTPARRDVSGRDARTGICTQRSA